MPRVYCAAGLPRRSLPSALTADVAWSTTVLHVLLQLTSVPTPTVLHRHVMCSSMSLLLCYKWWLHL